MAEQIDDIGFGGYRLFQDSNAFRYGVDAVMLAHMTRASSSDDVLDLCCGNGAVAFIIHALYRPRRVCGLELQEAAVALARKSAVLNKLEHCLSFKCGDALEVEKHYPPESFNKVALNPPYFEKGRGPACDSPEREIARRESSAGLGDFFRAAAYVLKKNGYLFLVHRPERLADIMELSRRHGLEPKDLRMVVPHAGEAPRQLLMRFIKGGGKGLTVHSELALRNKDGSITEELSSIYGASYGMTEKQQNT